MARVCWQAAPNGGYWMDVAVGPRDCRLMVDLGLVDPRNQIGCTLDPSEYDALKQLGLLSGIRTRLSRDASGRYSTIETARTTAQLIDPDTTQRVGPVVRLYVSRGVPSVPGRVGVSFFHGLSGCEVVWDIDARKWCVEYP